LEIDIDDFLKQQIAFNIRGISKELVDLDY